MSHLHHKVSQLVDGELHGAARQRALDHARRCADCRHELKATLALKSRMSGLSRAEPSPDLFLALSDVARGPRRHPVGASTLAAARSRLGPAVRRVLVGAGSVSLAVLSLAYLVGGPGDPVLVRVSPPVDEYTADFAGDTGLAPLSDPAVGGLGSDVQPAALVVARGSTAIPSWDASSGGDDAHAVAELRRAMSAPNRYAYDGTRQVQTFDTGTATSVTIDVEHVPGQGTTFEMASGAADETSTFVAQRDAAASASLDAFPLAVLVDGYDIAVVGSAVVLGRPVTVIAASRDGFLDARFWVDDATGLLVRREVYDGATLVRSTGFTSLRVSRDGFLAHLPPELEAPTATKLAMTSVAVLNDEGWTYPADLSGRFALTGLEHLETAGDVTRASYSDGLSTASVFEQQGLLDPAAVADLTATSVGGGDVYVGYGLPTVAVWECDGTVYTVVTDAPPDVADEVIASLPHQRRDQPGVGDRLVTGLRRIGSSLTPSG